MSSEVSVIFSLISDIDQVEKLLTKNICSIPKNQLHKLLNIMSLLSNELNGQIPLKNIIQSIYLVFQDGKLEVHEIPVLIKVLNNNISSQNIRIQSSEFSLLLKLFIFILMELNLLHINSPDLKKILLLIDSSLELLNIYPNIHFKPKWFCCH